MWIVTQQETFIDEDGNHVTNRSYEALNHLRQSGTVQAMDSTTFSPSGFSDSVEIYIWVRAEFRFDSSADTITRIDQGHGSRVTLNTTGRNISLSNSRTYNSGSGFPIFGRSWSEVTNTVTATGFAPNQNLSSTRSISVRRNSAGNQ